MQQIAISLFLGCVLGVFVIGVVLVPFSSEPPFQEI